MGAIKSREGRNWERHKIEEKKESFIINSPEKGGETGSPNRKILKDVRSRTKLSFVVKQETIKQDFDKANRVIAKHKTEQIHKTPANDAFD